MDLWGQTDLAVGDPAVLVVGTGLWVVGAFPLELGMDLFGVRGHDEETDLAAWAFGDVVGLEELDRGVDTVLVAAVNLAEGVEIDLVQGSYHAHQIAAVCKVADLVP